MYYKQYLLLRQLRKYSTKAAPLKKENKWHSVVGLEVHAQIAAASKLFSRASTEFASPVNNNVSLFDCAIPGTLPVLNKRCVESGVLTALALNCKVNLVSMFDRKHYFYGDLPTGYQITQQRHPLANDGFLKFQVYTPGIHKTPYEVQTRIKQLQLEQDSGKSLHEDDRSLVDLNRAGIPLMEIVFEPDLTDGEEAAALVKELTAILERLGTCSCKMEEGALRVDANVSVHIKGEPLGVRTEIKNIGSVRGVAGAIKYEIDRQINVLESGGIIVNETRNWDANSKTTVAMRDKEEVQDYRYMPEPNLPPIFLSKDDFYKNGVSIDKLEKSLPELPHETRNKLKENFGLSATQAVILVDQNELQNIFFDVVSKDNIDAKLVANVLINDLLTVLNKEKKDFDDIKPINIEHFRELFILLESKAISKAIAKQIITEIVTGNTKSPKQIVEEKDLILISDEKEIEKICIQILEENEKLVKKYKEGKTKVYKAFLGLLAKKNSKINMAVGDKILKKLLS